MSESADAAIGRMTHEVVGLAVTCLHTLVAVVALRTDLFTAVAGPTQQTPEVMRSPGQLPQITGRTPPAAFCPVCLSYWLKRSATKPLS